MSGPIIKIKDLDDFLTELVTNQQYEKEWELPVSHNQMHWYDANAKGIVKCTAEAFNLKLSYDEVSNANSSESPGWNSAVDQGLIKHKTIKLINSLPKILEWDTFDYEYAKTKV